MNFDQENILPLIDSVSDLELDAVTFGIVRMDKSGHVTGYNAAEAALSGLSPRNVIGKHFFTDVAPCTNNYLVAQRFETEDVLDAMVDYVFTLRMRPTPVVLRMLKAPTHDRMYLLVQRRAP